MKKIAIIALLMATLVAAPSLSQTSPPPTPREAATAEMISVSGVGRITLTPDRVVFTAGIETTAPTAADAVRMNSEKMASILAALKKAGATEKEIRTSNFSLYPQQEYVEGSRPRIIGYQTSNVVTVTRDRTSDVSKLLQAAIDAGANNVSGISFVVSDQRRGRDEGLREAFDDARSKAEILAKAAGRSLGRAISITEGSAPMIPSPMMMGRVSAMEMKVAQDVPVESGTEEIQFTVSVIFELR